MSFTLPIVNLSSATVGTTGTVTWASIAPQAAFAAAGSTPHLAIFNESGCGLTLQMSTGEQLFLPAGGWRNLDLNPSCTSFSYSVAYTMIGALVNSLVVVWFGPEEEPPPPTILGNSPIGGSTLTSTANEALRLVGQAGSPYGLTTTTGLNNSLFLSAMAMLIPDVTTAVSLGLIGRSNNGTSIVDDIAWFDGKIVIGGTGTPGSVVGNGGGVIVRYGSENLFGRGVPAMVAGAQEALISSTGSTTIQTYTTPNDGANHLYRVGGYVVLANGTSGNSISVQVTYTDRNTVSTTHPLFTSTSIAIQVANGSTSFVNGDWPFASISFVAKPNTLISLKYNDPTNTPNDRVTMYLERLS